jgi:hypothetical protein
MGQNSRRRISDRRHNRSAAGYGRRLPFQGHRVIPTERQTLPVFPEERTFSDTVVMCQKCRLRSLPHVANRSSNGQVAQRSLQ